MLLFLAYQYYKNVDMYYAYYQTPKSGIDSYLHCRGEDAHLAMPVNNLQAKILHELQQKDPGHPTQILYLGLARLGFQDIFQSNEFIAFTGWCSYNTINNKHKCIHTNNWVLKVYI